MTRAERDAVRLALDAAARRRLRIGARPRYAYGDTIGKGALRRQSSPTVWPSLPRRRVLEGHGPDA